MGERVGEPGRERSRRRFIKGVFGGGVGASMAVAGGASARAVQGGGPIRSFDHVGVPMRNTDAMVRFYRALGFTVNESARICSVHFGDQKINFHQPVLWQSESFTLRAPAAEPPCGDFCFVWEGSTETLRATLARVGADVIVGPVDRAGGRNGGTENGTSHYIRDPDDNLLEFIVY